MRKWRWDADYFQRRFLGLAQDHLVLSVVLLQLAIYVLHLLFAGFVTTVVVGIGAHGVWSGRPTTR